MAQLGLALITPLSTLVWFDALRAQPLQIARLVAAAGLSLLLLSLLLAGAIMRRRRCPEDTRAFWMLVGAIIVSWYPVSIMAHIGELYVHSSLFWFALLVGYATDGWARWLGRKRPVRLVALALGIVVYCACLAYGLRSNLGEIRATAERAAVWMARFDKALSAVPAGSRVLIYNQHPDRGERDYGLYRITTVQYLMLTDMSRPVLSYLTAASVHFYQVLGAAIDTPVYELHIRDDVIKIRPKRD
jgi:hypothetical protein